MMIRLLFILLTLSYGHNAIAQDPEWPGFRGNGNGIADPILSEYPTNFSKTENNTWRTEIPGKGWSSPVVTGASIWLTSAIEIKPTKEEQAKIIEESGEKPSKVKTKQVASKIKLNLIELNLNSGQIKRQITLSEINKPDPIHNLNSYASPTPCVYDNKVYAHFGTYGTWCFDTINSEILWHDRQPVKHGVGPGSSPIIHDDLLIMIYDAVDQQYVTAHNRLTGEQVWKTMRPEMRSESGDRRKAYSSPTIIYPDNDSPAQLICLGAQWIVSYDPATGEENWKVDHGDGFSVIPIPVFSDKHELIYFITGFPKPQLWAIDTKGKIVWKETKRIPAKPSPVVVGDEIYIINDTGIISCLDASTGELHWSERITGNYSASPLLAGKHLYFCSHEGQISVFRVGKTATIVAESNLDEQIMASPIGIGSSLIIRSADALYRFGR